MMVGIWWSLSLLVSLMLCGRIQKFQRTNNEPGHEGEQPLLVEAHDSPVGFKVRNIPDYPVDETLSKQSKNCCSPILMKFLGALIAIVGGVVIVFLSFTDIDDLLTGL